MRFINRNSRKVYFAKKKQNLLFLKRVYCTCRSASEKIDHKNEFDGYVEANVSPKAIKTILEILPNNTSDRK